MRETLNTGGLKTFIDTGEVERDLDFDRRMDLAYEKYYKRKKRNKILKIIVLAVIILGVVGWVLLK